MKSGSHSKNTKQISPRARQRQPYLWLKEKGGSESRFFTQDKKARRELDQARRLSSISNLRGTTNALSDAKWQDKAIG